MISVGKRSRLSKVFTGPRKGQIGIFSVLNIASKLKKQWAGAKYTNAYKMK